MNCLLLFESPTEGSPHTKVDNKLSEVLKSLKIKQCAIFLILNMIYVGYYHIFFFLNPHPVPFMPLFK